MKAVRVHEFGPPEVMRVEELPDPRPATGQVLVRIEAAGVNPVDTYIRAGAYARKPALPFTPGMDGAGVIEEVGGGVTGLTPGERVYLAGTCAGFGTYAEATLCVPPQVHPLPPQVSFAQGAAVNVAYATAYRALFLFADARPGETVLVHGASGGVGTAAVQMAKAHGLRVFGTAGTPAGLDHVRRQGADAVLDHRADGYLDEIQALTGGRGVAVILEMLANVNLGKDLTLLAPRGRVVVIGSRGTVEINPRDAMARDASIHGMLLFNASEDELRLTHLALEAGLQDGTLAPVVGRELRLAEAPRAHELVMAPGALGKIVLLP
jgi:NADPH2:quinone reductase